jgi:hypothetical protein
MKKLLATCAVAIALVGVALGANGYYGLRDLAQYDGVVILDCMNFGATTGYSLISLPTGFKMIKMIRVIPVSPGAAQDCTLTFWPTAADSSGGIVTVGWATTVMGEQYNQYFPVNCRAVSVGAIDATDDFIIEAYCSRSGSSVTGHAKGSIK